MTEYIDIQRCMKIDTVSIHQKMRSPFISKLSDIYAIYEYMRLVHRQHYISNLIKLIETMATISLKVFVVTLPIAGIDDDFYIKWYYLYSRISYTTQFPMAHTIIIYYYIIIFIIIVHLSSVASFLFYLY